MDPRDELVRIDDAGVVRPAGRLALQALKARAGVMRVLPSPTHVTFLRRVEANGERGTSSGPLVRLAGEVLGPGSLCDIVSLIAQAGWRGELLVMDADAARSAFFDGGNVVGAQSNAKGERIGEIMYELGALTETQVRQVSAQVTPERRFGEAAVALGFITAERLYAVTRTQTEEIVYGALRVADGMFYLLDGFDDARIAARHHLPANQLLMEGVRRMDEVKYFRERIPSEEHIPVPIPGRSAPAEELAAVFAACDGTHSVAAVGRACGLAEFDVTQQIFQLVQAGFLHIIAPRPTNPEAVVAIFNEAIREISAAAGRAGQLSSLQQAMSVFAMSGGVYFLLFHGADPGPDGTVIAEKIARNFATHGAGEPLATLGQWLYDYAAYALFTTEGLVPKAEGQTLQKLVTDRLGLLAPGGS